MSRLVHGAINPFRQLSWLYPVCDLVGPAIPIESTFTRRYHLGRDLDFRSITTFAGHNLADAGLLRQGDNRHNFDASEF